MRVVLSGNEAVARGAWQHGVTFAAAYPGTPSTEILETILAEYSAIRGQWAVNEKVAFDEALGASIGGARVLVAMKHVGLNVAADSLMTAAYTGVGGGFVVVSADDPGMHSSQNEQDNRNYAAFARIPLLEPADSQECLEFTGRALAISEQFDTPVLLRLTTRLSHTRCVVETTGGRTETPRRPFERRPEKYVMVPAYARARRRLLEERLARLTAFAETTDLNREEPGAGDFGLIASGVAYQYAKEAFPEAPLFKLGFAYPLPVERLRAFVARVGRVYVIEELDPFFELRLLAAGIPVRGKALLSPCGEYTPAAIRNAIHKALGRPITTAPAPEPVADLPPRPPVMCPGCAHRGIFYALKSLKVRVMGDIGCYTLGALPPLQAMDSCVCMGASVGMGAGLDAVSEPGRTVAVIGDSTFLHSGVAPLIDMAWNRGASVLIILDNRTTAMTGRQPTAASAASGRALDGASDGATPPIDLVALCRAAGIDDVTVVDPYDLRAVFTALRRALQSERPSVILTNRPCGLLVRERPAAPFAFDAELCSNCTQCAQLACPAILAEDERMGNQREICVACSLCAQVCAFGAIGLPGEAPAARRQRFYNPKAES